ncbi:hypothetical protein JMN32_06200 [Fulvivirga sp. 29W222]|uniref:Uncharacterized protein n=1 Tax=Fulvivirga marina TaxID=2494733 RepID=A0A937FWX4_9BACT|nr:hypothetical protein [Fulvivirga marina]MBL6445890.1 hypothetical protein [Fulvivirga marina]
MKAAKNIFHYISYLQYPFILISLFYLYKPLIYDLSTVWDNLNKVLILMGLGISLATLQDTQKMQNKLSRKVWQNPRYSRIFLLYLLSPVVIIISFGLYGLLLSANKQLVEIAPGIVVFGIGLIGFLKAGVEMAENHRKDQTAKVHNA